MPLVQLSTLRVALEKSLTARVAKPVIDWSTCSSSVRSPWRCWVVRSRLLVAEAIFFDCVPAAKLSGSMLAASALSVASFASSRSIFVRSASMRMTMFSSLGSSLIRAMTSSASRLASSVSRWISVCVSLGISFSLWMTSSAAAFASSASPVYLTRTLRAMC